MIDAYEFLSVVAAHICQDNYPGITTDRKPMDALIKPDFIKITQVFYHNEVFLFPCQNLQDTCFRPSAVFLWRIKSDLALITQIAPDAHALV